MTKGHGVACVQPLMNKIPLIATDMWKLCDTLTINWSLAHVRVLLGIAVVADWPEDGCIVDQHINAPILIEHLLCKLVYSGHVAEVHWHHIDLLGSLLLANLSYL